MKRIIFLLLLIVPVMLLAQNKVAVYVTSSSSEVDENMNQIIGSEIMAAIVKNRQYKAVERTSDFLRQINKEQGYQRSGNVDDQQISAIGKQFGVDYVCVANIMPYKGNFYIQARMIEVETATINATAREISTLADIDAIVIAASKVAKALVSSNETDAISQSSSNVAQNRPTGELVRYSQSERKMMGYSSEYYLGETPLDAKAMAKFYKHNCPQAYKQYYKGEQIKKVGWGFFGAGVGSCLLGMTFRLCADHIYHNGNEYDAMDACSWTFFGIGVPLAATSFVLLPIGYKKCHTACDVYNANCASKSKPAYSINLQTSANGLGLAFMF